MNSFPLRLMLADDDVDDCNFFKEALEELPLQTLLITVNDGEELMNQLLEKISNPPDVLFLDLNMPRKSGFECLVEIKEHENFKELPVIIYSTSLDKEVVNQLYDKGVQLYIRKPAVFSQLKNAIHQAITFLSESKTQPP